MAGRVCTVGTKGRTAFIPAQDATVVTRLRTAGAIVLGKTNLPELGSALRATISSMDGRTIPMTCRELQEEVAEAKPLLSPPADLP